MGKELLDKYMAGTASSAERRVVEEWYATRFLKEATTLDSEEDYLRIKAEMWQSINEGTEPYNAVRRYKRWTSIAAAAVLLLGVAGLSYYFLRPTTIQTEEQFAQDIAPGSTGATLTLSDGRRVHLNNLDTAEALQDAGVSISKNKDGILVYEVKNTGQHNAKTNTLSTAKGETYMMVLPDKSKVWLNASSSLTYHHNIRHNGVRKVYLEGEAYFEVAKDQSPFIVESRGQQVRVLGTHFNVNTYEEEKDLRTTLLEGSVRVSAGNRAVVLKPGEQSVNKDGELGVYPVDTEAIIAWKNGYFKFDGSLETVMRDIARWYDVDVQFDTGVPNDLKLWGFVSRSNNLREVLRQVERVNKVHFEIDGHTVVVKKLKL